MIIQQALINAARSLKSAGIDTHQLDARILLKYVLDIDDAELITSSQKKLSEGQYKEFKGLLAIRATRKPISKILGIKEFWGREFIVNEHVLDPRPDTEILIEQVLAFVKEKNFSSPKILELGCGSGCISITLACEIKGADVTAIDISPKALDLAQQNANKHDVGDKVRFIQNDWAHGLEGMFDIVISNPPYIARKTCESLMPEVKNHDPILALDGGISGNEAYENIFSHIFPLINPQGVLFFELDSSNLAGIRRLCETYRVALDQEVTDLSEQIRVVKIIP